MISDMIHTVIAMLLTAASLAWVFSKMNWIMTKCKTEPEGWQVFFYSLGMFVFHMVFIWVTWSSKILH